MSLDQVFIDNLDYDECEVFGGAVVCGCAAESVIKNVGAAFGPSPIFLIHLVH